MKFTELKMFESKPMPRGTCITCNGEGRVPESVNLHTADLYEEEQWEVCEDCGGTGVEP